MAKKALIIGILFFFCMSLFIPLGPVQGAQRAYVAGEIANLRTGPGTEYELVYTLEYGTELLIYDQASDSEGRIWFSVYIPSLDLEGWIASWLVSLEEEEEQPLAGNSALVNSAANLRSGPSQDYDRISSLEAGTPVTVVGSAWTREDEVWYQIETPAGEQGWIYTELLQLSPEVTVTSTEAVGKLVQITQLAPLRRGPGLEQNILSNLPPGSGGKVVGVAFDWRKDTWFEVELLDGEFGWVVSAQTQFVSEWPLATIEGLTYSEEDSILTLTITGRGYLTGTPTLLGNPDRIVLDIPYAQFPKGSLLVSLHTGDILRARLRSLDGNKVRLFIDLKRPVDFWKELSGSGQMVIKIRTGSPRILLQGQELPPEISYLQQGPILYIPLTPLKDSFSGQILVDPGGKGASFSVGNRTLYFINGDERVLIDENGEKRIYEMSSPALITSQDAYLPTEASLDLLGLYSGWNAQKGILSLDPQIVALEAGEKEEGGKHLSYLRVRSSAPLIFQQKSEEDGLLYLDIPHSIFLPQSVTSTGILIDVSRTATVGTGDTTLTVNLGRAQTYRVDVPPDSFGLEVIVEKESPEVFNPGNKRVVIDPGHGRTTPDGYYDGGAIGPAGTKESEINLDIALRLRALLEGAGITVIMTRTAERDPSTPDLEGRVAIAEASHADLCLSIHNNSVTDPAIGGTETYYAYPKSMLLAKLVQEELVVALRRNDRGYRIPSWRMAMVQDIKSIPSVLTEIMFISNPEEEQLLLRPDIRQMAAEALFRAIMRYLSSQ